LRRKSLGAFEGSFHCAWQEIPRSKKILGGRIGYLKKKQKVIREKENLVRPTSY